MSIRAAYEDPRAYEYLKLKNTLTETGSDAVFADGVKRRAFIVSGDENKDLAQQRIFVELENYSFADPRRLPGFQSFQLSDEEKAWQQAELQKQQAAEAARSHKLPGTNWDETRQAAQAVAAHAMAERFSQNQSGNSEIALNSKWASFAEAAQKERNRAFRS